MAIAVDIVNKQRKISVNAKRFGQVAVLLAGRIMENLSQSPPKHLSVKQAMKIKKSGAINVVLVSDRVIRQLNKTWRHKDNATDVLSFPLMFDQSHKDIPFELGEIFISVERAHEQALAYGHSFEKEMAFLFVHGFLHILGFDHVHKKQEMDMFSRQSQILKAEGLNSR